MIRLITECNTERERIIAALEEKASRQDHFASEVYTQHTPEVRKVYRHAAAMLRDVAAQLKREGGK